MPGDSCVLGWLFREVLSTRCARVELGMKGSWPPRLWPGAWCAGTQEDRARREQGGADTRKGPSSLGVTRARALGSDGKRVPCGRDAVSAWAGLGPWGAQTPWWCSCSQGVGPRWILETAVIRTTQGGRCCPGSARPHLLSEMGLAQGRRSLGRQHVLGESSLAWLDAPDVISTNTRCPCGNPGRSWCPLPPGEPTLRGHRHPQGFWAGVETPSPHSHFCSGSFGVWLLITGAGWCPRLCPGAVWALTRHC